MVKEIRISRKEKKKGDDGYKIISVRMKEEIMQKLEYIAAKSNRSRNEVINILLEEAIRLVKIQETDDWMPPFW